jgi:hypothetical protein
MGLSKMALSSQRKEDIEQPKQLVPALLAVNKQIHSEALLILYQQHFILEDTYTLHTFLAAIGSNRSHLTHLTVCEWGSGRGIHKSMNFASMTLLGMCTNLKKLMLDCHVRDDMDPCQPKNLARQIWRDAGFFLEAYGIANGRMDAGIDVLQLDEWDLDASAKSTGPWAPKRSSLGKEEFKKEYEAELRKLLKC